MGANYRVVFRSSRSTTSRFIADDSERTVRQTVQELIRLNSVDIHTQRIEVQFGRPGNQTRFDAASIVAGQSGGWTDVEWCTLRSFTPIEFAAKLLTVQSTGPEPAQVTPATPVEVVDSAPSTAHTVASVVPDSANESTPTARHAFTAHKNNRWTIIGSIALVALLYFGMVQLLDSRGPRSDAAYAGQVRPPLPAATLPQRPHDDVSSR